ncbi:MAG: amidohydrolase [Flavobacteriales bacterium]|nr:amidohydrolase [Flavobacteriales bacterium]
MKSLKEIRRHLHANPEVSGNESETAKFIYDELKENCDADELIQLDCHAVIARFKSSNPGKTIMIRGDIDALPIQEINSFEHRSKVDGVSHKCGHDGHATILIGLARKLSESKPQSGEVILLFQPSEENGMGAKAVIDDPYFKKVKADFAYALHNLPGFPKKEIVIREKQFNAHVISMIIKLSGKTAHAAEPEFGHNPALTISKLLLATEQMVKNEAEADDFFLITPIHMNLGDLAYGISAGYGEIHYTIRAWDSNLVKQNCLVLEQLAKELGEEDKLKVDISYDQEFAANMNDDKAVDHLKDAVKSINAEHRVLNKAFKWGEDFGLFTQMFPGAMFGIGSGEDCPALHNPDYDYPDEITDTAVDVFFQTIKEING